MISALAAVVLYGCGADRAGERFKTAELLLGAGDYAGAVAEYSRVVRDFHDSSYAPESQYKIALVYNRHLSDEKRAMDAYSTLLYLFPESPEARLAREDMAGIFSARGEHLKAIEEYERLAEAYPADDARLRFATAMEYFRMNDFRQARIELAGILKKSPPADLVPRVKYRIAYIHYIEGDTEKALEAFDEIARDWPDDPLAVEALLGKAKALEEAARPREALEILKGLLDRYPNREVVATRIKWVKKRMTEGPGPKR